MSLQLQRLIRAYVNDIECLLVIEIPGQSVLVIVDLFVSEGVLFDVGKVLAYNLARMHVHSNC